LDDAKVYANHAKKKVIDLEDVKLAVQMTIDRAFTTPPPRDVSIISNVYPLHKRNLKM
jgi:transcription initiation factor TFIID subunit 9B